jgi:hypothetical protein
MSVEGFPSAGNGKKCVGKVSRVQEMAKNAWGRFPERGKWQKIHFTRFPNLESGKN